MAVRRDLTINQGETYSINMFIEDDNDKPLDLTGYSGASQMRKHPSSLVAYDFNVVISEVAGIVTMSLSAVNSALIPAGRYVYDCKITDPDGKVTIISYGLSEVFAGVTRES